MFDIAWSEILVILIVAAGILDPKDFAAIIKSCSKFANKLTEFKDEAKLLIQEISSDNLEQNNDKEKQRYITDLEGNIQPVFDLTDIDELLKKTNLEELNEPKNNDKTYH